MGFFFLIHKCSFGPHRISLAPLLFFVPLPDKPKDFFKCPLVPNTSFSRFMSSVLENNPMCFDYSFSNLCLKILNIISKYN